MIENENQAAAKPSALNALLGARSDFCDAVQTMSMDERDAYNHRHGLPINPVSATLGMSGECLCGAYAHKGEKAMVRIVCPETWARIDRLEQEVFAAGWNWGWEGKPPKHGSSKAQGDMFLPPNA